MTFFKPKEGEERMNIDMTIDLTKNGSHEWENTPVGYCIDKNSHFLLLGMLLFIFWGKLDLMMSWLLILVTFSSSSHQMNKRVMS